MTPRPYSPRSIAAWREQAAADQRDARERHIAALERRRRRLEHELAACAVLAVLVLVLAALVLAGVMS